jgi:hypothetical protein
VVCRKEKIGARNKGQEKHLCHSLANDNETRESRRHPRVSGEPVPFNTGLPGLPGIRKGCELGNDNHIVIAMSVAKKQSRCLRIRSPRPDK